MEKVRIRKIIEDIIITQFLNSEIDIVHEEDVTFTVPVISLTMLLRPSLRHWESLISFRLQIL